MALKPADFPAEDFYASRWAESGYWDDADQVWLIEPASSASVRSEESFLAIGRPGVDGIEFGYRLGEQGLWAYYPMTGEFLRVADSVNDLVEGWLGGRISL